MRGSCHSEMPARKPANAEGSRSPNPFPVEPSVSSFRGSADASGIGCPDPRSYYSPEARAAMDRVFTGIRQLRPEAVSRRRAWFWEGTLVPKSKFSRIVESLCFKFDIGWRRYWVWRFGGKK